MRTPNFLPNYRVALTLGGTSSSIAVTAGSVSANGAFKLGDYPFYRGHLGRFLGDSFDNYYGWFPNSYSSLWATHNYTAGLKVANGSISIGYLYLCVKHD